MKVADGNYAFMNSEAALKYLISAKYTNQYRQAADTLLLTYKRKKPVYLHP